MIKIAVIGASGFVGSAISKAIEENDRLGLIRIFRGDDIEENVSQSDVVIHCANSPKRYKAEIDPEYDFIESVHKTNEICQICKRHQKKLVLISSISARTQLNTVYGINRRSCELLVLQDKNLVLRLGYMFSATKIYGALKNLVKNEKVYLKPNSEYSYSDINWNTKKILELTLNDKQGLYELGSTGSITLGKIAEILESKSKFVGNKEDIQIAKNEFIDSPAIDNFIRYLHTLKNKK